MMYVSHLIPEWIQLLDTFYFFNNKATYSRSFSGQFLKCILICTWRYKFQKVLHLLQYNVRLHGAWLSGVTQSLCKQPETHFKTSLSGRGCSIWKLHLNIGNVETHKCSLKSSHWNLVFRLYCKFLQNGKNFVLFLILNMIKEAYKKWK